MVRYFEELSKLIKNDNIDEVINIVNETDMGNFWFCGSIAKCDYIFYELKSCSRRGPCYYRKTNSKDNDKENEHPLWSMNEGPIKSFVKYNFRNYSRRLNDYRYIIFLSALSYEKYIEFDFDKEMIDLQFKILLYEDLTNKHKDIIFKYLLSRELLIDNAILYDLILYYDSMGYDLNDIKKHHVDFYSLFDSTKVEFKNIPIFKFILRNIENLSEFHKNKLCIGIEDIIKNGNSNFQDMKYIIDIAKIELRYNNEMLSCTFLANIGNNNIDMLRYLLTLFTLQCFELNDEKEYYFKYNNNNVNIETINFLMNDDNFSDFVKFYKNIFRCTKSNEAYELLSQYI